MSHCDKRKLKHKSHQEVTTAGGSKLRFVLLPLCKAAAFSSMPCPPPPPAVQLSIQGAGPELPSFEEHCTYPFPCLI